MARYLRTTLHLGLRTLLPYIIALVCIVGVQPVLAQDPVKHKVQLPNEEEWEADPPYAAYGETVKITYKGSKFVKDLRFISPSTLTLEINETFDHLQVVIYSDLDNVDKSVTWESKNTDVATVDENGAVTAHAIGTAIIVATTKGNDKLAEITVVVGYAFSVASDKKVVFSPGNLQYNTGTQEWRFAQHQYDVCHAYGDNIGEDYEDWKKDSKWTDLFGWGMWLDGTAAASIIQTKEDGTYNPATTNDEFTHNKTTVEGTEWSTFSSAQWQYLLGNSDKRDGKYGWGSITDENNKSFNGLILLPDDWTLPMGCRFTSGMSASNKYGTTGEENLWSDMEAAGAVFLPAAGLRSGASVFDVGSLGNYWSSTANGASITYCVDFYSGGLDPAGYGTRRYGRSVRLVRCIN